MIEHINNLAQVWWTWMSAMFWQVGLLIILIATIDLLIRRWAWPQLRYALWSLILLKLVLSPALSLPSALTPRLTPVVTQLLQSAANREAGLTGQPGAIGSADYEFSLAVAQPYPGFFKSGPGTVSLGTDYEHHYDTRFDTSAMVVRQPDTLILTQPGPRLGWRFYVMAVWLLGVVTLSTWLFLKLRGLGKEHSNESRQPVLPESFYNQMDRCAQRLNLRRKPRVVATTSIQSPAVFGLFRPVLLMPAGYIRRLSRKDVEHMLLHELAHIKRGDLPTHSFCMLLLLVYWYNPLLWLVRRQLRHLRELCCDATVATLLKDKTADYRQTLLEAARRFLAMPVEPALGLVGLFEDPNRLVARINWLKKPIWRYRKMKNIAVVTITLILLACVLPMAQGQHQHTDNQSISPGQTLEPSSPNQETAESEREQQTLQRLEAQLHQLQTDKQNLEKELKAIVQARAKAEQEKGFAKETNLEAEDAKDKAVKAKVKAHKDASKAEAETLKAVAHAKQWEHWANSEAFKKWQKDMEVWAKEQARIHEQAFKHGDAFTPGPNPKPHPMPAMPPMPVMPHPKAGQIHLDIDAHADAHADADVAVVPEVNVTVPPMSTGVAVSVVPDGQESVEGIKISKTKDGKFIATKEMQLDLKVKPGKPFIVRNSVGNLTLRPSKDGTCEAKALIRAEADTAAEAQEKVQEVSMNVESSKDKFYLKPVKPDDNQWSGLNVDLIITVPPDVQPDIKTNMGSIDLLNLKGQIKAVTNMGSVKAVNTTGNLELVTKMGSIDFIAPKDLSAKLRADTKMGSLKSELPLDVNQTDMFKRTAEGTIGSGQGNIGLHTDMGSISLRWQPSPDAQPLKP